MSSYEDGFRAGTDAAEKDAGLLVAAVVLAVGGRVEVPTLDVDHIKLTITSRDDGGLVFTAEPSAPITEGETNGDR